MFLRSETFSLVLSCTTRSLNNTGPLEGQKSGWPAVLSSTKSSCLDHIDISPSTSTTTSDTWPNTYCNRPLHIFLGERSSVLQRFSKASRTSNILRVITSAFESPPNFYNLWNVLHLGSALRGPRSTKRCPRLKCKPFQELWRWGGNVCVFKDFPLDPVPLI